MISGIMWGHEAFAFIVAFAMWSFYMAIVTLCLISWRFWFWFNVPLSNMTAVIILGDFTTYLENSSIYPGCSQPWSLFLYMVIFQSLTFIVTEVFCNSIFKHQNLRPTPQICPVYYFQNAKSYNSFTHQRL